MQASSMIIRPETSDDYEVIQSLTNAAFEPKPFGDGNEGDIISAMRIAGDLLLSLVAEEDGAVIGQASFSPVKIACAGRWASLGPIAVVETRQRQGIGSELAKQGLNWLEQQGYDGCVLIGNPKVYGSMGFVSGGLTYRDLPEHLPQYVSLSGLVPSGEITFATALEEA